MGQIINLHPWEYNEVPVLMGEALKKSAPVVALHLTRPAIEIPDREKLGIPSHFEAARGAYLIRDRSPEKPKGGTVIVQGTSAMSSILQLLPQIERLNLKVVYATSPQLFSLQPKDYRHGILSSVDQLDSTVVTTQALWLMHDLLFTKLSEEYALSADWDDRWRTGGTLEEILDESHLNPYWLLSGLKRFALERPQRLERLGETLTGL